MAKENRILWHSCSRSLNRSIASPTAGESKRRANRGELGDSRRKAMRKPAFSRIVLSVRRLPLFSVLTALALLWLGGGGVHAQMVSSTIRLPSVETLHRVPGLISPTTPTPMRCGFWIKGAAKSVATCSLRSPQTFSSPPRSITPLERPPRHSSPLSARESPSEIRRAPFSS